MSNLKSSNFLQLLHFLSPWYLFVACNYYTQFGQFKYGYFWHFLGALIFWLILSYFHFFARKCLFLPTYPQSYQQKQMFVWITRYTSVTPDKCLIYADFNLKIPLFWLFQMSHFSVQHFIFKIWKNRQFGNA